MAPTSECWSSSSTPTALSARASIWAPAISATELIAGPLLALGLFTRLAAIPIVLFLLVACRERWVKGGWFWNTQGLEYTLMWTIAAAYFLAKGGGMYSLDYLLGMRMP